ncbi:hypothetical protein HK097_002596 [Rhizophlyctis rosea]|uniref:Uncharacterized protein n=1 Tax=Rhizophlyctis rosea TaxID=64517 RepID=A0AAD5WXP4_9FUNG|nr:hypothetical protein HK097_002596 [Rhizophlyctis rosea]
MSRQIRYTSFISPRVDPVLFLTIGIAGYLLHDRQAHPDPHERLPALLSRKYARWRAGIVAPSEKIAIEFDD